MRNIRGFSLIQVMIASAIMSGLMLVSMQHETNRIKGQSTVNANVEINAFISYMNTILADGNSCGQTLYGTHIGGTHDIGGTPIASHGQVNDIIKVTAEAGGTPPFDISQRRTVFSKDGTYGSNEFVITDFQTKVDATDQFFLEVHVRIEDEVFGSRDKRLRFNLEVRDSTGADDLIDECSGELDTLINEAIREGVERSCRNWNGDTINDGGTDDPWVKDYEPTWGSEGLPICKHILPTNCNCPDNHFMFRLPKSAAECSNKSFCKQRGDTDFSTPTSCSGHQFARYFNSDGTVTNQCYTINHQCDPGEAMVAYTNDNGFECARFHNILDSALGGCAWGRTLIKTPSGFACQKLGNDSNGNLCSNHALLNSVTSTSVNCLPGSTKFCVNEQFLKTVRADGTIVCADYPGGITATAQAGQFIQGFINDTTFKLHSNNGLPTCSGNNALQWNNSTQEWGCNDQLDNIFQASSTITESEIESQLRTAWTLITWSDQTIVDQEIDLNGGLPGGKYREQVFTEDNEIILRVTDAKNLSWGLVSYKIGSISDHQLCFLTRVKSTDQSNGNAEGNFYCKVTMLGDYWYLHMQGFRIDNARCHARCAKLSVN
jgi:hypothetical protein